MCHKQELVNFILVNHRPPHKGTNQSARTLKGLQTNAQIF